jgi:hypothetical protein
MSGRAPPSPAEGGGGDLSPRVAVTVFLALAFAYFFSALLRGVTATLAPAFSAELGLRAADLGLLAGAYFLGFASLQLPLGRALDLLGPRRVVLALLSLAVAGCAAFAMAGGLVSLFLARALIGMGLAACLMAPLTLYRRWFSAAAQLRANSWMLMTGSLGMLASTLPVQWLLPVAGWRGLFWLLAGLLLVAMALIAWLVPADDGGRHAASARTGGSPGDVTRRARRAQQVGGERQAGGEESSPGAEAGRYRDIVRHPLFVRMAPLGFFLYGGLIAMQSLWVGPWLTRVHGATPGQAAQGLFLVNLCMLFAFLTWGVVMPRLTARGWTAERLMRLGLLPSLAGLAALVWMGSSAGAPAWALWCVSTTLVTLSQPAVGQAFPAALAGRALSAFNLVIFAGVFALQWGIGLVVDGLMAAGFGEVRAFQGAAGAFCVCCWLAWAWFLRGAGGLGR